MDVYKQAILLDVCASLCYLHAGLFIGNETCVFTIVAERINCTRKMIRDAVERRDAEVIRTEAVQQAAAGATYLDVNAGTAPDTELDTMVWLLGVVQSAVDLPISVDSASPAVIEAGLRALDGRPALINSISLEPKAERLLELAQTFNTALIGLCLAPGGMPNTAEERLALADQLMAKTRAAGIADDRVYLDPLVRAISAEPEQGAEFLQAVRQIRAAYPDVHFCPGMSNVSFGLPRRTLLNRAFLSMAIGDGLDGAILDPTDTGMQAALLAARALAGVDDYCAGYIAACRAGVVGE